MMSEKHNELLDQQHKELLAQPVRFVKGVGEARAGLFRKLGINTIEDLLYYFPRDYEDRRNQKRVIDILPNEECSFIGLVASKVSENMIRKGLSIYKAQIRDDTGFITCIWYNQKFIKNMLQPGARFIFFGKAQMGYKGMELQNPVIEKLGSEGPKNTLRIVPVYPSTQDLSQNIIRTVVDNAVKMLGGTITEVLPGMLREKYSLMDIDFSIKNIHFHHLPIPYMLPSFFSTESRR